MPHELPGEPTVFLVDDDASVRTSLARLLRSAGYRAEAFASARQFLQRPEPPQAPACLVLDVNMPGLTGLELQQELQHRGSMLPIIFITGHGDIPMSVQAMKQGAIDFLPKPFQDNELLSAIERALRRHREATDSAAERDSIRRRMASLTPREREVMALVVTGLLNKEAAAELGISEKTIKVHRGRVMEKMEVRSLAELVRLVEHADEPARSPPAPATANKTKV